MNSLIFALVILAADPVTETVRGPVEADELFSCAFEEDADRNFDHWPDDWTRRRARGYPSYLPIEIVEDEDQDSSPRPNHCVRIGLDGGAAELFSPQIPVVPQYSYQLKGRLRTRGLQHDIVTLTLSFYDAEDRLLESHETERYCDVPDWTDIQVGPVTPAGDRVRSAVLSLHVRPGDHADLTGEILLDDLWLGRLPKMTLEVPGENGIFVNPRDVSITCRVSGFKNPRPELRFELLDVYGNVLHRANQIMDGQLESSRLRAARAHPHFEQRPGFAGVTSWHPPVQEAGFYTVRVSTPTHSGLVTTEQVNFVVLSAMTRHKHGEFGWSLHEGARPLTVRQLPVLLNQLGIHWVKYPVWFGEKETKRAEDISWLAERLGSFDIKMIGVLDEPPVEIRQLFGDGGRLPIATAFTDKAVWHPALDPVLTRLSLKIHWWQLGRDDDTSFSSFPDLKAKLTEIRDDLASFGQTVHVGVPWKMIEERPNAVQLPWAFFSLIEDLPLTAAELKQYAEGTEENQAKRWVVLQPLRRQDYSLETRATDLVQRMLAAKIANADAVFIPQPFHSDLGLMQTDGSPGPLLLPWRTTSLLTGGAEYAGTMKLPQGSENLIFIHEDEAIAVLWNDRPVSENLYLGESLKQYDVWGRVSVPVETRTDDARFHSLPVGPMPTFVTGIDPAIARWRMGFEFKTTGIASIFGREQQVLYQFANSFPQGVSGEVRFHVPEDWKVEGNVRDFKLSPGESHRGALRVKLGADATSGSRPIRIDFKIHADREYEFSLFDTLRVGLGDVLVTLETRFDEEGNLVVDQHLTNNTDKSVSFKCFLSIPGRRRERTQVFNAGRGRTTNTYVIPDGRSLVGAQLWFRAEEIDGVRVLNDQLIVQE